VQLRLLRRYLNTLILIFFQRRHGKTPSAWSDKVIWVQKYLGEHAHKRLILSHHKNLNDGDFLVDDRLKNGVDKFKGEHIHFGEPDFLDWTSVVSDLLSKA